jgi:serine/threonine-protein kinase
VKNEIIQKLRSTPITVSEDELRKVFGLDENWRPLEYIQNEYEDNGDGTVTDHATGLMWQQYNQDELKLSDIGIYVRQLNKHKFAGYSDWRLPTVPELMSLLEPEKQSNNFYLDLIFEKEKWWYWTADQWWIWWSWSADQIPSGGRFFVSFDHGSINMLRDLSAHVRAVRSVQ